MNNISGAIKCGEKTVEVRLNDDKRRKIKVGDTIQFLNVAEQNEELEVRVTDLRNYDTFKEMYEDIPLLDFDCNGWTIAEMVGGTYDIYTPEQKKTWGTLAISIQYPL